MKYHAACLVASATAVQINQYRDNNLYYYEDDHHLGEYEHGDAFRGDLHFLDIDYGYGRDGLDIYDQNYGYGPQIAYDGYDHGLYGGYGGYGTDQYYNPADHEYRYLDFYSNDSHSYSDSSYDSKIDSENTNDASSSHHTSDSDFTDFSNGTFSDDGYAGTHDGYVTFHSEIDVYTHSDDFDITSYSDGPNGHSHGYYTDGYSGSDSSGYQRYYSDGHSYDSFSDGHFGPDGHFGHGIYGDYYGTEHYHSGVFNGHDYGNVDEFINGGALAFGNNFGYNVEELGYGQRNGVQYYRGPAPVLSLNDRSH